MDNSSANDGFGRCEKRREKQDYKDKCLQEEDREFFEKTCDEIFENEDFAFIVELKGYHFFVFLDERHVLDC